jgi:hypothetical protein
MDQAEELYNELNNIMGIGPNKAKILIEKGLTNIKQLKNKKYYNLLNEDTKVFLEYNPERKIPHEIIKLIEPIIKIRGFKIKIVGSYRRKKAFSSDIDLMIVSDEIDIIEKYINSLKKKIKSYTYSMGLDKASIIIDLREMKYFNESDVYKIDIFRTIPENEIPMLIYSTGSKQFNIIMRSVAKKRGYKLNQNGLYKDNKKIELKTEKDYFDFLNMTYRTPSQRSI